MKLFSANLLAAAVIAAGAAGAVLSQRDDRPLIAAWDDQRALVTHSQRLIGEFMGRRPGEVLLVSLQEQPGSRPGAGRWTLRGEAPSAEGPSGAPRRFVASVEQRCAELTRAGCLELARLSLPGAAPAPNPGQEPAPAPAAAPEPGPLMAEAPASPGPEPQPAPPESDALSREQPKFEPLETAEAQPLPEPETPEPETLAPAAGGEAEMVDEQSVGPEIQQAALPEPAAEEEAEPLPPPDETVRRIQAALRDLDYDPGPADGLLGERTRAAIEAYQRARGLPADGQPSEELLARMEGTLRQIDAARRGAAASAKEAAPAAQPQVSPAIAAIRAGQGAQRPDGQLVLLIQDRLIRFGFQPLPRDGRLDPATREAIRRYQQAVGLPATGVPTRPLLEDMDSRLRKLSAAN